MSAKRRRYNSSLESPSVHLGSPVGKASSIDEYCVLNSKRRLCLCPCPPPLPVPYLRCPPFLPCRTCFFAPSTCETCSISSCSSPRNHKQLPVVKGIPRVCGSEKPSTHRREKFYDSFHSLCFECAIYSTRSFVCKYAAIVWCFVCMYVFAPLGLRVFV